jgi:hypothetical protein
LCKATIFTFPLQIKHFIHCPRFLSLCIKITFFLEQSRMIECNGVERSVQAMSSSRPLSRLVGQLDGCGGKTRNLSLSTRCWGSFGI